MGRRYSDTLNKLASRILSGNIGREHKRFLDQYYDVHDKSPVIGDLRGEDYTEIDGRIRRRLASDQHAVRRDLYPIWLRGAAAAIILLILSVAVIHWHSSSQVASGIHASKRETKHIIAGSNKAMLTLSDGRTVSLNDSQKQIITGSGGEIASNTAGRLSYAAGPGGDVALPEVNLLSIPRGGTFRLRLSDGTEVWLNAESRLKYPVVFRGKERVVELEGEAYFEVAHVKDSKFIVKSARQQVEVLGTHFNVCNYPEQRQTITTLLEGKVNIRSAAAAELLASLSPGQQSSTDGKHVKIRQLDPQLSVAWQQGLFRFDHEDIGSIMEKISRWYDVEVVFRDDMSGLQFGGSVSRFADIEKVLRKLELTNSIHFKIEGRRIIVMK